MGSGLGANGDDLEADGLGGVDGEVEVLGDVELVARVEIDHALVDGLARVDVRIGVRIRGRVSASLNPSPNPYQGREAEAASKGVGAASLRVQRRDSWYPGSSAGQPPRPLRG